MRFGLVILAAATVLCGCASAPRVARTIPASTSMALEWTKDEEATQVRRFADRTTLASVATLGLPKVDVAADAIDAGITAAQSAVVVNRAARDVCTGLAPYFRLSGDAADTQVHLRVWSMRPTSAGAAGLSEVVGFFVPGPFRIPAGLGGLAIDGELRRAEQPIVLLQWSQGANPLTEGARISAIGDAYQLAGDFADDFVAAVVSTNDAGKRRRTRQPDEVIAANKSLCRQAFGKASIAGTGAALLIGLPPESTDSGAPRADGSDDAPVD